MAGMAAGARLLVDFRAGKMTFDGKLLAPDSRKGLLRVIRTDDGLVHLQWFERLESGAFERAEDDVILFPEEAKFEKVPRAPGGRVYLLKFPNEKERNMFFWSQEPEAGRDDALSEQVNQAINTALGADEDEGPSSSEMDIPDVVMPPSSSLERATMSGAPGAGLSVTEGDSMGQLPSGPAQQQLFVPGNTHAQALAQMLSAALANAAQPPAPPAQQQQQQQQHRGGPPTHEEQLAAALLQGLAQAQARQGGRPVAVGPTLSEVLRPDVVAGFLREPGVLERLGQYLPESQRTPEALSSLAHSPQFQQQLHSFSTALASGQIDLAQFGLNAQGFSVMDFLRAIQEAVDRELQQSGGGGDSSGGAAGDASKGGGGAAMQE